MQNNQNMSNMSNMLNMQIIHKNAVLVHKIVYLALRPLFLVPGVAKTGASSSSVSFTRAALGLVLVPAAAAGEGTAGAAGAEVAERPPRRCFIEHIPLGEVSWVHRRAGGGGASSSRRRPPLWAEALPSGDRRRRDRIR